MSDPFFGLSRGDSVVVAYSGGVDSAYAAELCRSAGFRVTAVTLALCPDGLGLARKAADSARKSGLEHRILDLRDAFREKIMRRVWLEYSRAVTPNPCAVCNPLVKFGMLHDFAKSLGAKAVVTGHYAILEPDGASVALRKGLCAEKDQSYFLFAVPERALAFCRTPLGALIKKDVKRSAGELGLDAAKAKESQDICFGGDSLPETLAALFPDVPSVPGKFFDESGHMLGPHRGVPFYTIGQRKGTGVALGKPAYVKSISPAGIVLATDETHLLSKTLKAVFCNFLKETPSEFRAMIRTRYRSHEIPGTVRKLGNGVCEVVFDSPVRAAAPGQAAVFYDSDRVLGGGWIAGTEISGDRSADLRPVF